MFSYWKNVLEKIEVRFALSAGPVRRPFYLVFFLQLFFSTAKMRHFLSFSLIFCGIFYIECVEYCYKDENCEFKEDLEKYFDCKLTDVFNGNHLQEFYK